MKTKAILSVIVALLMVSSIASASFMGNLANVFYKQVDPQANTAAEKSAVAAAQKCTANADCGTGTCTSCKCIAANALTGNALAINLPPSTLIKTGVQAKASSGTLITPKASGTASASGALGAADTTINTCLTECKARCRTECGTTGASTGACATTANCVNGYCNSNRVCVPCTLNSQCGTGKVCIIQNPDVSYCMPPQTTGRACNENADCASNNCGSMADLGATRIGTCAAALAAAKTPLTLSSGLKLNIPTGNAIVLSGLKASTSTLTPSTGIAATTNLAINAVCTSASQCASKICSMQAATATMAAHRVCSTTCKVSTSNDCVTGKVCSSGRCITPLAIGVTCTSNAQCSSTYCDQTGKCAAMPANAGGTAPKINGAACTAGTECASAYCDSTGKCAAKPTNANIGGIADNTANAGTCISACEARCEETCNPKIANGAACNNPAHCGNQCASRAFECFCEGNARANAGGLAQKEAGETCDANPQCVSAYCDKVFPDRQGICAAQGATGDKTIGEGCTANIQCQTGRCQLMQTSRILRASGGPDAVCAEPLEKDIEIGEPCFIHSQCKSNYCNMADRVCAPTPAAPKQPLGVRCVENKDCESNYCSTDPETLGKSCAEQTVEALPLEVERQVRTELDTVTPQLEMMERQVVEDGFVASREALIAMSGRHDCYEVIDDVALKAECLSIRFETVTDLLQSKGIFTVDKAMELKEKVKKNAAAGETTSAVTPPPAAQVGFVNRVRNLFRFTGSFWKVTGGFELIETEVQVGTAGEELPVIQAVPTNYLNDLDTQYSQLTALETAICLKLPIASLNTALLKGCQADINCKSPNPGITINPFKCENDKCVIKEEDVCPAGEFGAVVAPVEPSCDETGGCHIGYICDQGTCVVDETPNRPCTTAAQCRSEEICRGGICTPRFTRVRRCVESEDCPAGYICNQSRRVCVADETPNRPCTTAAQCRSGEETCRGGICAPQLS